MMALGNGAGEFLRPRNARSKTRFTVMRFLRVMRRSFAFALCSLGIWVCVSLTTGCMTFVKPPADPPQTLQVSKGAAGIKQLPTDPDMQQLLKSYYYALVEDKAAERDLTFALDSVGESTRKVKVGFQIGLLPLDLVCCGFLGFTFPDRYSADYRLNLLVTDRIADEQHELPGTVYRVEGELRGLMGWRLLGWERMKRMVQNRAKANALHQRIHNLDRDLAALPPPTIATPTPAALAARPDAFLKRRQVALVIGIDGYAHHPALFHAVSDAKKVADLLKRNYGFEATELYDGTATHEAIVNAMKKLIAGLQEGDNVFLYFSGHGAYSDVFKEGYWVPVEGQSEAGYIWNHEIHAMVKAMDKAQHVFLVADSCFSGSFVGAMRDAGPEPPQTSDKLFDFLRRMDRQKSRLVLTSGASKERVPDKSEFAYYFLRALENPPNDGIFTALELAHGVQKKVGMNAQSKQTPQVSYLAVRENEDGQMVLVRKP